MGSDSFLSLKAVFKDFFFQIDSAITAIKNKLDQEFHLLSIKCLKKLFIDEAKIFVKAGDGGSGCVSFRREKHVPHGGPDGGDGGNGGSIIVAVNPHMRTLLDFQYLQHYKADRGQHGMGKKMYGKRGEDKIIMVPLGTIILDDGTGEILADFTDPNERIVVAVGGKGGRGNIHFTSSTNRAPRRCEPGEAGDGGDSLDGGALRQVRQGHRGVADGDDGHGGARDGQPREVYLHQVADNQECMSTYGVQAVVWQTAVNPVIAMELLSEGVWNGTGVLGPEAFDPDPFVERMPAYDFPWGLKEMEV